MCTQGGYRLITSKLISLLKDTHQRSKWVTQFRSTIQHESFSFSFIKAYRIVYYNNYLSLLWNDLYVEYVESNNNRSLTRRPASLLCRFIKARPCSFDPLLYFLSRSWLSRKVCVNLQQCGCSVQDNCNSYDNSNKYKVIA